jgi:16S rRNA pseudouridine516 synthase
LATLEHSLSQSDIDMLEKGITLADGTTLKEAKVEIIEDGNNPLVQIMICEGKYHQVKRMFAAAGNKVVALHRSKMGDLELDCDLKPGECREITQNELKLLTER